MNIFVKTFGCKVNQAETQTLIEQCESVGHKIVSKFEEAHACILNTCTVTEEADKDTERMLRVISKQNPSCRIIATGCYVDMHPQKVLKNAPSAIIVVNKDKKHIAQNFFSYKDSHAGYGYKVCGHKGHSRAFVKIQDGCDAKCRYCIVRLARHIKSSKPLHEVTDEIRGLIKTGFKEIVLTGINIGNYICPITNAQLPDLAEKIFAIDGKFRIRFSSIEINSISDRLIDAAVKGNEKFCNYFHIPLQSGSDKVLNEMGRHYNTDFYERRIKKLRKIFPHIGIFSDIIVGYPTETENDFSASKEFIKKINFSGLHVFRYSQRPWTEAALLKNLSKEIIAERALELRDTNRQLRKFFAESLVGSSQNVLIEKTRFPVSGISSNFQKVLIDGIKNLSGLKQIKIVSAKDNICHGRL